MTLFYKLCFSAIFRLLLCKSKYILYKFSMYELYKFYFVSFFKSALSTEAARCTGVANRREARSLFWSRVTMSLSIMSTKITNNFHQVCLVLQNVSFFFETELFIQLMLRRMRHDSRHCWTSLRTFDHVCGTDGRCWPHTDHCLPVFQITMRLPGSTRASRCWSWL